MTDMTYTANDVALTPLSDKSRLIRDYAAECGSVMAHAQRNVAFRCYNVTVFGGHLYECDTLANVKTLVADLANKAN